MIFKSVYSIITLAESVLLIVTTILLNFYLTKFCSVYSTIMLTYFVFLIVVTILLIFSILLIFVQFIR